MSEIKAVLAEAQEFVDRSNAWDFDWVSRRLRAFYAKRGLIESPTQCKVDILSACEDTQNLGQFQFVDGKNYPLRQTGQMGLEEEMMRHPNMPGFHCQTTSYRFEQHPNPARHKVVFQMSEFEFPGGLEDALIPFERELLSELGFEETKMGKFQEVDYLDVCKRYGVNELTHEHEARMEKDYGPIVFLKYFPASTSPFWNMRRVSVQEDAKRAGLSKKCDVIMYGVETIGSAERSCNVDEMRACFSSIMGGSYAQRLYDLFGKERVLNELEAFFKLKCIPRSGAGIGMSRLIRACKLAGLIPPPPPAKQSQL